MKKITEPRVQMDSNWMVKEADRMRKVLREARLEGVTDLVQRTEILVEIGTMDWNELNAAVRKLNKQ